MVALSCCPCCSGASASCRSLAACASRLDAADEFGTCTRLEDCLPDICLTVPVEVLALLGCCALAAESPSSSATTAAPAKGPDTLPSWAPLLSVTLVCCCTKLPLCCTQRAGPETALLPTLVDAKVFDIVCLTGPTHCINAVPNDTVALSSRCWLAEADCAAVLGLLGMGMLLSCSAESSGCRAAVCENLR